MIKVTFVLFLVAITYKIINGEDVSLGLPVEYDNVANQNYWNSGIDEVNFNDIWTESDHRNPTDNSPDSLLKMLCAQYDLQLNDNVIECENLQIVQKSLKYHNVVRRETNIDDLDEGSGDDSLVEQHESNSNSDLSPFQSQSLDIHEPLPNAPEVLNPVDTQKYDNENFKDEQKTNNTEEMESEVKAITEHSSEEQEESRSNFGSSPFRSQSLGIESPKPPSDTPDEPEKVKTIDTKEVEPKAQASVVQAGQENKEMEQDHQKPSEDNSTMQNNLIVIPPKDSDVVSIDKLPESSAPVDTQKEDNKNLEDKQENSDTEELEVHAATVPAKQEESNDNSPFQSQSLDIGPPKLLPDAPKEPSKTDTETVKTIDTKEVEPNVPAVVYSDNGAQESQKTTNNKETDTNATINAVIPPSDKEAEGNEPNPIQVPVIPIKEVEKETPSEVSESKNKEDVPKATNDQVPIEQTKKGEINNVSQDNKAVTKATLEEINNQQSGLAIIDTNEDIIGTEILLKGKKANENLKSLSTNTEEEVKSGASEATEKGGNSGKILIVFVVAILAVGAAAFAYNHIKKNKIKRESARVTQNNGTEKSDPEQGREMKPLMTTPLNNTTVEYNEEK